MKAIRNVLQVIVILFVTTMLSTSITAQETPDPLAIRDGFAEALNNQDLDGMVSFFADDGVWDWVPEPGAPLVGKAQIRTAFDTLLTHSPDWHTDEGLVLTDGEVVVVNHNGLGTQTGPLPDGSTTNAPWVMPHLDIYEFEGDKIKKLTTYDDHASFYIQLGLMPAPEIPPLVPSIEVPDHEPTGLSPMEANAEHIRRWNSHDAALMARIYHNDAKIFAGPLGAEVDRAAMTAMNEMYFAAFPNIRQEAVRTIDLGDNWVLTEFVAYATHQGPFMGIAPSGYPIENRNVWLVHYSDDGVVTQGSFYYDNVTFMTQMTEPPEYSPAGNWVGTTPTPVGNITFLHTVSPQVELGGPFAGYMTMSNKNPTYFGMFPDADASSDWLTITVWKGRNSVESTMLRYGTKKGEGLLAETVYIFIAHVSWTLTGPNTNEGTALAAVYLPEQDADGDGFPDPGEEPVDCSPFAFTSRRLTMMPPCIPDLQ